MFPRDFVDLVNFEGRGEPFYFGLGFIKVRLSDRMSCNFYHPELIATVGPEEVHDHRYDFISTVYAGELTNEIFTVFHEPDNPTHSVWDATCKEGEEEQKLYDARTELQNIFILTAGSTYTMQKDQFHKVSADQGAITYLSRQLPIVKKTSRVLRAIGAPPACPYATKIPVDELYAKIEELYSTLQ
jgi:hypothetical protein